ncbi:MAG: CHRD domain-containing protein [Pseudomonadota bacterium]
MTMFRIGALALAGGAALVSGAVLAQDEELAFIGTSMFGNLEAGHEGAGEEVSGDFSAELDMKAGRMCYMLEVAGADDFVAAHIHKAKAGENGPPVVTLELLGEDGEDVCVEVDAKLLKDLAKNRAKYYVNVHTAAFPEGAIRGQLGRE